MMGTELLGKKSVQNTSQAIPAKMISGKPQLVHQAAAAPLLTLNDVASMLAVSKAWVRDHATRRNPRIPVVRFGGRRAVLRFRREDVTRFISKNLVSTEERDI
jgi:predicted DNA-binding transcriptional regulator AlpA